MKNNKKAKRRDIYKNVLLDGEYYIESKDNYEFKFYDENGIRKTRTASTLDELRDIEDEIQNGSSSAPVSKKTTVTQAVEVYLNSNKKVNEVTLSGYYYILRKYITPSVLGHMKVVDVYKIDVLQFYNMLIAEKHFKKSTVELVHHILNPTFRLALDCRAIRTNPCNRCLADVDDGISIDHVVLSCSEQAKLMRFIKENYRGYYSMIKIHFSIGIRPSELLGLTKNDVNLRHDYVNINHQLLYRKIGETSAVHRMKITKTDAGDRIIEFNKSVHDCFLDQMDYDNFIYQAAGIFEADGFSKFLFITSTGKPMTLGLYNRLLDNIILEYNEHEAAEAAKEEREVICLPHISGYSVRRTGLTRMAESGINPKTLQIIAGHSKIETTYNYYVKVTEEFYKEDMQKYFKYKRELQEKYGAI